MLRSADRMMLALFGMVRRVPISVRPSRLYLSRCRLSCGRSICYGQPLRGEWGKVDLRCARPDFRAIEGGNGFGVLIADEDELGGVKFWEV